MEGNEIFKQDIILDLLEKILEGLEISNRLNQLIYSAIFEVNK